MEKDKSSSSENLDQKIHALEQQNENLRQALAWIQENYGALPAGLVAQNALGEYMSCSRKLLLDQALGIER